ncbi:ABC transporter ATP-binding protein [Streptomyces sp. B-S-A8]|uniref:ABC transporter ATP-binding protein n=1 Tax=Streptomyces solicavernae TaxID=3043614 RepID=A0ABT6RTW7_9ACTN|nr:ABC transporter ATP-binding protein [Streptomyces sp. B-S-A8]MDI3387820.1 ABC transporter ATP-binding protein [Streptomyces sp. B-S-A8]
MSWDLEIRDVSHEYRGNVALNDVSLSFGEGEFVTLLGPSGCGKTTLLRAIAGFLTPRRGRILLGGEEITGRSPDRRPVNMVFQRPTLFPHLNVADNIAFGLRVERRGKQEIARRVEDMLGLVDLADFGGRRAHELSGGQMQRVAMARALIKRPRVLLLDEPLSALDLKVRLQMEVELRRMHRETGATFVHVTHDQREALALSDRIALFDRGRLVEFAAPEEIYRRPNSAFAAQFVGDANVLPVDLVPAAFGMAVQLGEVRMPTPPDPAGGTRTDAGPAWLMVRPESIRVSPVGAGGTSGRLRGSVLDTAYRGDVFSCRLSVPGVPVPLKAEVPVEEGVLLDVGADVDLAWPPEAGRVLPLDRPPAVPPVPAPTDNRRAGRNKGSADALA